MRSVLAKIRHWLAHRLRWNAGKFISQYDEQGRIWIGFRCSHCGKVDDWYRPKFGGRE